MERLKGKDGNFYSLDEITPELYVCPAGEERSYHVVQEVVEFTRKGQRISSPRLQKYGQKIFETIMRDSLMKQGYDVKILHNPKEWIANVANRTVSKMPVVNLIPRRFLRRTA